MNSQSIELESYHGLILSPRDALYLIEAARIGKINTVNARLKKRERHRFIKSGAVFVWEDNSTLIKRWTDSRCWSSSRIAGKFLTYNEIDFHEKKRLSEYDEDELLKQRFSVTLINGQIFHLISYCSLKYFERPGQTPRGSPILKRPSNDEKLVQDLELSSYCYQQEDLQNIDDIAAFYNVDSSRATPEPTPTPLSDRVMKKPQSLKRPSLEHSSHSAPASASLVANDGTTANGDVDYFGNESFIPINMNYSIKEETLHPYFDYLKGTVNTHLDQQQPHQQQHQQPQQQLQQLPQQAQFNVVHISPLNPYSNQLQPQQQHQQHQQFANFVYPTNFVNELATPLETNSMDYTNAKRRKMDYSTTNINQNSDVPALKNEVYVNTQMNFMDFIAVQDQSYYVPITPLSPFQ